MQTDQSASYSSDDSKSSDEWDKNYLQFMQTDLVAYYASRATEYEKLYEKPERQQDLARLSAILQDIFREKNLLEVACGTGWWTQRLALTAGSVLATDINESMLDITRSKYYANNNVRFQRDDIFQSAVEHTFDGLFGGFIWSHIPLEQLDVFLGHIRRRLQSGATLVFIDNLFVPGSSTPISHTDKASISKTDEFYEPGSSTPLSHTDKTGNTYQTRLLEDGSEHRVLKNFPAPEFLKEKLSTIGGGFEYRELDYYWLAACKMPD